MTPFWLSLPMHLQDGLTSFGLLLATFLVGFCLFRGFAPWSLVVALLKRFAWANALFVILIGCALGLGIGLLSQERGLRQGSAQAADKFDLIVAAPGSEITTLLATVFLQPTDLPLINGDIYSEVETHPRVSLAAPLAFGDSWQGFIVVGTTAQFLEHLTEGSIEGRFWLTKQEAVAGSAVPLEIGETFEPSHGFGDAAQVGAHAGEVFKVVGKMSATGSPWDQAILVPVEEVWAVHGLATGHAPERADQLGPPYDAAYFPGTPAVVIQAESLGSTYSLQAEFNRETDTMAFFPGAILNQLHRLMGDISEAMRLMARVTQILVTLAVLLALFILTKLFQPQMAMLRALGAPGRFVMAVVWSYATTLLAAGAVLGVLLGLISSAVLAQIVAAQTGVAIPTSFAWGEVRLVLGFVSIASLLSLIPAWATLRAPLVDVLRR
ncbi:MAG: FtsX-like permease family protein [Pseudomonadota bacterium]